VSGLALLIPIAIALGLIALAGFFWALRSGQYEDLEGASERIFNEDERAIRHGPSKREG
jgi:cbb3-type cytochrome oxidase maturation protein